ncbi:MAG: hypothetical protein KatS3mg011_2238 [Acidimicrobiia bacterium]|nr:MAG: hypothetical protein KatS3mg011_2238 [Acidimicrobiia bacterium]
MREGSKLVALFRFDPEEGPDRAAERMYREIRAIVEAREKERKKEQTGSGDDPGTATSQDVHGKDAGSAVDPEPDAPSQE